MESERHGPTGLSLAAVQNARKPSSSCFVYPLSVELHNLGHGPTRNCTSLLSLQVSWVPQKDNAVAIGLTTPEPKSSLQFRRSIAQKSEDESGKTAGNDCFEVGRMLDEL
jgi:hypothetical protein